jgi:NAD(P)-dependent dehydrogenase (short-subunit alcohol dehydrogenase family)
MTQDLSGTVVALTGGGRGIGASTTAALVARGAVVAVGDVEADRATETADHVGGGSIGLHLDVTDRASFDAFLDQTEERLGDLDVLVNNAGIMPLTRLLDEPDELTARVLDVNVRAMIHGTREAARRMVPRGRGHIVNVASTAGKAGIPGAATYCASKAATVVFSEAVHLELQDTGVHVSCVMPGIVRTELTDGVPDMKGFRAITPEQVAEAIADAVAEPRFEVFVPRSAGTLLKATAMVPRRAREWVGRSMGVDHVSLDAAEDPERAGYESRIRGS